MPITPADLALIILSVAVSALCSGLEIAFVTSNKLYVELERKRGAIWARITGRLYKRPARVIGALLVGNNIALVVYGVVMARILEPWLRSTGLEEAGVLIAQTVLSTLLILVVGEFLPKALFRIDPNRTIAFFALPMAALYVLLWPLMMLMTGISELVLRAFGVRTKPGQTVFGRRNSS